MWIIFKREDTLEIVSFTYDENDFLIKGAIDQVAHELQVSRYTIYNYLEELKAKNKT
jgi:predicted transcriptional regulator YheO